MDASETHGVDRVAECEALRAEDVPGPRVERPMPSKATALEIARLAEVDGENGLEQAIDYCLGLLEPYAVPRWDQDRIVIENGWLDGRCGRCGEALPKSDAEAERDEARAQLADLQAESFPKSWAGFRAFLDEVYPDDVFPDDGRDLGPAFVVAARRLAATEARLEAVQALHRQKTFDGYSDHHHAAAVAALGAISPHQHDCTDACFETFTICAHDGLAWPCSTAAALASPPEPEADEVQPYETPEEAAAADAIPPEPISPEFRKRLIDAVERPLRVRRAILLLAGHASGHLPGGSSGGCRVCHEHWPCGAVHRAADPALEAFADTALGPHAEPVDQPVPPTEPGEQATCPHGKEQR